MDPNIPKLDLDSLFSEDSSGSLELRVNKVTNGLKVNVITNLHKPNSTEPMSGHQNTEYVFDGSPSELILKLEEKLGISQFFKVIETSE